MTPAQTELNSRLAGISELEQLSAEEAEQLLTWMKAARKSRMTAMMASIDEALEHLPRLLRGPAKKILLG